jgi:hypothetical protein
VNRSSGVVTANAAGTATIAATDAVGVAGRSTINVTLCQPNAARACSAANGTGSQTCASDGNSYGVCAAVSCNGGYQLNSGLCSAIPQAPAAPAAPVNGIWNDVGSSTRTFSGYRCPSDNYMAGQACYPIGSQCYSEYITDGFTLHFRQFNCQ